MLKPLYATRKRILITVVSCLVVGVILGMVFVQVWFDYEVKKQLKATETSINSIEILNISYTTKSANLTVNTSISNPHDLDITISETNFSVEYHGTNMGVVCMPKIILTTHLESLVFNTTFVLGGISLFTYLKFGGDLVDGEVAVNITGKLTLSAPALFFRVYSTTSINSEIVLTTDLITSTNLD